MTRAPGTAPAPAAHLLESLREERLFLAAELRPPRLALSQAEGMDAWIDTYHSIRSLTRRGTHIFVTDRAVGRGEEENLRHLSVNLGRDADKSRIIQFLTAKHSVDYCLSFPARAFEQGFRALVVVGGDPQDSVPRCVAHACELRRLIRERFPAMLLGGWANPRRDPRRQVEYILDEGFCADFFLTQVMSHYDLGPLDSFLEEAHRRGVAIPAVFGIFYYRSASPRTLSELGRFIPVPAEGLKRDFARGIDADTICALTLRALLGRGVRNFYVSNLDVRRAGERLAAIRARAEAPGGISPRSPGARRGSLPGRRSGRR